MVGKGEEFGRAGEERAAKIRAQAITENRQVELIDDAGSPRCGR